MLKKILDLQENSIEKLTIVISNEKKVKSKI